MTNIQTLSIDAAGQVSSDMEVITFIDRMRMVCLGEAKLARLLADESDENLSTRLIDADFPLSPEHIASDAT